MEETSMLYRLLTILEVYSSTAETVCLHWELW